MRWLWGVGEIEEFRRVYGLGLQGFRVYRASGFRASGFRASGFRVKRLRISGFDFGAVGCERVELCLGGIICVNWGISGVKASLKLSGSGPPSTLNLEGNFVYLCWGRGLGMQGSVAQVSRSSVLAEKVMTCSGPGPSKYPQRGVYGPKLSVFSVYNRG